MLKCCTFAMIQYHAIHHKFHPHCDTHAGSQTQYIYSHSHQFVVVAAATSAAVIVVVVCLFVCQPFQCELRHRKKESNWNDIKIACRCALSLSCSPASTLLYILAIRLIDIIHINGMVSAAICKISLGLIFIYFYDYDVEILRLCLLC